MRIDNGVRITIRSTCSKVVKWGSDFIIDEEDMMNIGDSAFAENNKRDILTPTCLVPVLALNAAWIESGMISARLAGKYSLADIEYFSDEDDGTEKTENETVMMTETSRELKQETRELKQETRELKQETRELKQETRRLRRYDD